MSTHAADRLGKWLAIGGAVLAIVAIVLGMRTMGTPAQQRLVRIDERRVSELHDLQVFIRSYAKEHGGLPTALAEVAAQPGFNRPTRDPETGVTYEYARIDAERFRLCAVFATDTARLPSETYPAYSDGWQHGPGRHCFTAKRKDD